MIGLVSSLLGVVGGEMIILVFILLLGVDVKVAGSMSMLVGIPMIAVGLLQHFGAGSVLRERTVWRTAILPLSASANVIIRSLGKGKVRARGSTHAAFISAWTRSGSKRSRTASGSKPAAEQTKAKSRD